MWVSAIWQSESAVCIHISPPPWIFLLPPSCPLGHHGALSKPPRATQHFPLAISHKIRSICQFYSPNSSRLPLPPTLRPYVMAQMVKHLPTMREAWVQSLGRKDPLEKAMATHSSTLAWKIPWTEERCSLQSMRSQRLGHDWATSLHFHSLHLHLYYWSTNRFILTIFLDSTYICKYMILVFLFLTYFTPYKRL